MGLDPQKARYPALGFIVTAAFVGGLGWMLYDQVLRPSMQPPVDYIQTGTIR